MTFSMKRIKSIYEDNYTIEHLCDSSEGSSGGPLINSMNYKVIGVHKGGAKGVKEHNLGTLIKKANEDFIKCIKNKIDGINKDVDKKENKEKNIKENNFIKEKIVENNENYKLVNKESNKKYI